MCGIAGFIDYNKQTSLAQLQAMGRSLAHRGPDGEDYKLLNTPQARIGLAHRRLSIIDLSDNGKQPMTYRHWTITFNGEVYNYQEIRKELTVLGHTFTGSSDTEVVLHAFAEWGMASLQKMVGMFAFVLVDTQKQQLYACRDRAGVKPLFYYWQNGLFLFASELKAFHQHPQFKPEINIDAVAAFMQYGYVPTPHCIFKHTHKLPQGHCLVFDIEHKTIDVHKYWDVNNYYNRPKININYQDALVETTRMLQQAFEYRMVADVPVGVFLSGGYDSSCVTALLQKERSQALKTFTIGVGDSALNEAPYARRIAQHLGTNHTEYECTEADALAIIPTLPFYYDEPFGDHSAIPTILVSQQARQAVTVSLSADAGDEVFAGYNRYDYINQLKLMRKIPIPLRSALVSLMNNMPANRIPFFNRHSLFSSRYEKIKLLLQDTSAKNLMTNMANQFLPEDHKRLFCHQVKSLSSYFDEQLDNAFADDLSAMMATDYKTYLADDILQKVDRATMSVGLEGREPFLDHQLIEWVAQLPTHFKYKNGVKKYILRDIVHQYIPKNLMERPKMGFAIPMNRWLKNDLKPYIQHYLDPNRLQQQGIFNASEVDKYVSQFLNGKDEYGMKVWYLLSFQLWYEKWR
jgi:asparagine synthase (glutamine-hydrolysing)